MPKKIKLIKANIAVDNRGELIFSNEFNMKKIKRFYHITNYKTPFIRAWHAHKREEKFIIVTKGSASFSVVKIDNWRKPSKNLKIQSFVLSEKNPKILNIPGGYAHGYQTLLKDTHLIIFSTASIKESLKDDFRYDAYYWNPWKIKER
tara:strand:- start:4825 stop:5268 length:444 start_codon:yes stop_codon:yes gene_type:complete